MMSNAQETLNFNGRELYAITADSSVLAAMQLMKEKGIGAVPVAEDSSQLDGVLSEQHCAHAQILKGLALDSTHVAEIIADDVATLVDKCMCLMRHDRDRWQRPRLRISSGSDVTRFVVREQNLTRH